MSEEKQTFKIDDKEYAVEDLGPEDRTRLGLIVAAENKMKALQIETNLLSIAKEETFKLLRASLENDGTTEDT